MAEIALDEVPDGGGVPGLLRGDPDLLRDRLAARADIARARASAGPRARLYCLRLVGVVCERRQGPGRGEPSKRLSPRAAPSALRAAR